MDETARSMFEALHARDVDAARTIIRAHPNAVNAIGPTGISVFLLAAYMRENAFLSILLEAEVELNVWEVAALGDVRRMGVAIAESVDAISERSADGWTALHLAAHFGHAEVCRMLLIAGADVCAWSDNGLHNQPLHAAVAGGNDDVVFVLLDAGADVNAQQHGGFTPLHGAAQLGAMAQVTELVARGADTSVKTDEGYDAATLAEGAGFQPVVDFLRSR
jgi:ankyrin repeat protein